MGFRSPSESSRLRAAVRRLTCVSTDEPVRSAPPMRFVAPSAYPRTRQRPDDAVCLTASPAPSGFLDLSALRSATCLLALFHARSAHGVVALQSFAPLAEPYAVSGACTLMSLNAPNTTRTPHPSLRPKPKLDSDGHAASHPLPCAEAPGCGSAASSAPPESRRSDLVEERA
jgi:hypothetical protein